MIPEQPSDGATLRVGTSSWTAPSWAGTFYPPGLAESEWLSHYARRFDTVEIDATWYRSPTPRMVEGWAARTPPGFLFAAKAPQAITHEQVLVDCEAELDQYLLRLHRDGRIHLLSHVDSAQLSASEQADCLVHPSGLLLHWIRWLP